MISMSLVSGKIDPNKKVKNEGWIRSNMMIEALAINKDAVKCALEKHVKGMESIKTSFIYKKEFGEIREVKNPIVNIEKAYSYVVELELVSKDFESLLMLVMMYAPTSVEIIEPKDLKLGIGEAQAVLVSVAELVHRFAAGLVLEGYADWQDRPDGRDVSTLQAFAGWQAKAWRASLQYGRQERRAAGPGGSDLALDFVSAFAWVQVAPRVALLGRVDRNFDPIPNGETMDYMPFSADAKSVFALVGVDVTLAKTVHLIPNVEMTAYDDTADGTKPGADVVPRVTLFFSW